MHSHTDRIDLSTLKLIHGGKIVAREPFTLDCQECEQLLEIPDTCAGFHWVDSHYIVLDCMAEANSKVCIRYRWHTGGDVLVTDYSIIPNRRVKMCIRLDELESKRWFLVTRPGTFKGHVEGRPTHIDKVDKVEMLVEKGRGLNKFTIYDLFLTEELPDLTVHGDTMVDEFGQWKDIQWSNKIHSQDELVTYLRGEYNRYKSGGRYPSGDWSPYGGWTGKRFEPKGHFYKVHDGRRWWLVDPDGCAFFSNGVCYGSRMGVHGFVDGMTEMFDFLPPTDDPVFGDAWATADQIPEFVKRNGVQAGRGRRMYNFPRSNMIRAFGDKWWNAWLTINTARMKEWGFNTISVCVNNYFDEHVEEFLNQAKIPFTWTLKSFPKTTPQIFRDFPDVFSNEYADLCRSFAEQIRAFEGNPYFIGYFINNEPEWLVQRGTNPAERLLGTQNSCASRAVLIDFLRRRYHDDLAAFNAAWKLSLASFDDLLKPIADTDRLSDSSARDLADFRNILIEKYVTVPTDALKAIVPNALNLGMRYASISDEDFAGDTLFDMFSFNCYARSPKLRFDLAERSTDVPVIVGEWHFGGSDTGLLSNALVNASTQVERGKACANYMQTAMTYAQCVGIHYFEFNDQPVLGRFDGENMQHGLIDVCNQPHAACIEQMAAVAKNMYGILNGDIPVEPIEWEYHDRY